MEDGWETITTASGRETVPMITLENMEVLGQESTRIRTGVFNLPPEIRLDGLIGLSFLHHYDIFLGYRKGLLTIN